MPVEFLPLLFFLIALFYSSVGFGGGSSYLALLSLFLVDFHEIRTTALVLNTCVVSIGTFWYIKNKIFNWKEFWPFLASSIPVVYVATQLRFSEKVFFLILGSSLILSALFLMLRYIISPSSSSRFSTRKKLILGSSIGLLAGISGIGGGIFLSPILHLLHWANARSIAALASVFILVNSVTGLVGVAFAGTFYVNDNLLWQLAIAVTLGGALGAYLSVKKLSLSLLGILTALLVLYVGLRLVLLHGWDLHI